MNLLNYLLLVISSICLLNSCKVASPYDFLQKTESAANNQIMLVRQNPPSLGYMRILALSSSYSDLSEFIQEKGVPEFLAETTKSQNRYFILYYLSSRKAFACRTGEGRSRLIEFSGPYPITNGEAKTLDRLRSQ